MKAVKAVYIEVANVGLRLPFFLPEFQLSITIGGERITAQLDTLAAFHELNLAVQGSINAFDIIFLLKSTFDATITKAHADKILRNYDFDGNGTIEIDELHEMVEGHVAVKAQWKDADTREKKRQVLCKFWLKQKGKKDEDRMDGRRRGGVTSIAPDIENQIIIAEEKKATRSMRRKPTGESMRQAFDAYDLDGSGGIDDDELRQCLSTFYTVELDRDEAKVKCGGREGVCRWMSG